MKHPVSVQVHRGVKNYGSGGSDIPSEGAPEVEVSKDAMKEYEDEMHATETEGRGNPASWVADEGLWDKAKRASEKALGRIKYPFVVWWYMHHGGTRK